MSELPNDMDLTKFMDEVRSLHLKLDSVTKTLSTLDKKINDITESQQIGGETVRKSANSINIIIRFLADLSKLSPEELKNTLVEADAILNTVNPIPTDQNLDNTLEWNVTKDKLKTILKEVFDLLSSLPLDIKVNANNSVASTSTAYNNSKVEEEKILFWRKYKNKYNYIEKLKPKLPPLNNPVEEVVSLQDDVNGIVQNNVNPIVENDENSTVKNDLNDNTQNNVNDTAQNDLNGESTCTVKDIIQNEERYEFYKSRLQNSPYDNQFFKTHVKNSILTLALPNGETYVRPVSYVAPLIVLKKCDDICPIPLLKKTTDEQFQSTSNNINDSNSYNTTAKMIKRETRANKTKDVTNSFNTNVKTTTEKRRLTIKTSKYEPSKKKKN
ncbi:protein PF14_0175 [Acyrthosiphon pisum]|uniref:Uncharacterized protein n=1 Tax=Acyrthosiphon pisum TaxID=7029 RepID=A0A8R2A9P4_ACYPI|nr:protein PF14_0175 [Acyrthosiphon pisum]|eukprot:XP_001947691.2 PREDICTED: protein PF14_0175-like [Acyrthosiphon pisum]